MPRRTNKRVSTAPEFLTYSEFYAPVRKEPPATKSKKKKVHKTVKYNIPLTRRIEEAVKELGSARGVSFQQIKKYLDSEYPCSPDANPITIRAQQRLGLRRAVEAGILRPHALHAQRFVRSPLKKSTSPKKKAAKKASKKAEEAPAAAAAAAPKRATKKDATGRKKAKKSTPASSTATPSSPGKLAKKAEELVASEADPASGLTGTVHGSYSCSLKLIDIAQNMDKYYILQVIEKASGKYAFFTRWGRTGAVGNSANSNFDTAEEAEAEFEKKFKEKTGNNWGDDFTEIAGKYKLIVANDEPLDEDVIWQYWVDDKVDGKADGWYNYANEASETVETVYQENTRNSDMEVRCVQSGAFSYRVDFKTMTQTNLTHSAHKQRKIRRSLRSEL